MLEPIEVMALDENMNRASGGIAYRSLIWRRRYYECGTFELYVPKNIYKTSWAYIYTNDRPEMGIIQKVTASDDVHAWGGKDTVKVSGRFAESLLSRKVLIPSRVTGYGSTGDNVAVSMQWAQEIFGDRFEYLAPDFEGVERAMAPKPSPYGLILYDELKMAEASYRVLYDFTGNTWTVQPWRGLDRTQSQLPIAPDPDEPDVPDEPTIDDLYEPLDYIVSTGEQWIDTGVYPNGNTRVVMSAESTSTSSTWVYGAWGGVDDRQFTFGVGAVSGFRYGSTTSNVSEIGIGSLTVDQNGNAYAVNSISGTVAAQTFECPYPLFIGCINAAGTASSGKFYGRFNTFKIYADGTLVRDLVPKRRISDGAVGMLDLVNEVFYPSASGVAFLAPGELPAGYTQVECIMSTGAQYIDTGFTADSTTKVVMDLQITSTDSTVNAVFGARTSSGKNAYFACLTSSTGFFRIDYGTGQKQDVSVPNPNERKTITQDANVSTISPDGVTYTTAAQSFTCDRTMLLFAFRNGSSVSNHSYMRLYSCQIYGNGTDMDRDYVPAKNGSGEAGLFDMVSMTFFADASETGFVAGPEVTAVSEVSTFALTRTVAASEETTEVSAVNAFALFSDQMGTIRDYVAVKDASNYKNTCLIDYEYEEPVAWNGDGTPYARPVYEWVEESQGTLRELVGWQIPYNIRRGTLIARIADDLPDDEAYLDLTGTKPKYDGEWSRSQYEPDALPDFPTDMRASYAAFPAALEAEGFKHLQANHPYVEEIDTGELSTGGYLKRWDLGDKVDALLLDIGIDMEARITGVDEAYEGKTRSVVPIIGEKKHRRI